MKLGGSRRRGSVRGGRRGKQAFDAGVRVRRGRKATFELLEDRRVLAALPISLGNINQATSHSNPGNFVEFGGLYYFTASDGINGSELWRSDGTAAGTTLLKDINPGSGSGGGVFATVFNGELYFRADDGVNGQELWKTDGTEAGTVMVKNINPSGPSSPFDFTVMGGALYFLADDGVNSVKLWKTDGTNAGTVLVDTTGGTNSDELIVAGSTLYFAKSVTGSGVELWKSNGTAAGTALVKEIRAGSSSASPSGLMAVGATIYFSAHDGTTGEELWKSDGTNAGTVRVIDLAASGNGFSNSAPQIINVGGTLYFFGFDGTSSGLYKSNGTAAGTTRLANVSGNRFTIVGSKLFFRGVETPTSVNGNELWVTEGTAATTMMVKDIEPGSAASSPDSMVNFNGVLAFVATDSVNGSSLWTSDGTLGGTNRVDVDFGPESLLSMTVAGSTLLFGGSSAAHGRELWRSDGTAAGTTMVKDINVVELPAGASVLGQVGGKAIFAASDIPHGSEIWISDGTPVGTTLLADIMPGAAGSSPSKGIQLDANTLLFVARGELWRTDGTPAGTTSLAAVAVGGSSPSQFAMAGGVVYFNGIDAANGRELWRTDGTAAGTYVVKNIHPTGNSNPGSLTAVGELLYFSAEDGTNGTELWKSDGTAAGTVMVANIATTSSSSNVQSIVALGNRAVFAASTAATGFELWVSDGTAAGTTLLKDVNVGTPGSNPNSLVNINGRIYFAASDGVNGQELWVTDGTPASTGMVVNLSPGGDSFPSSLTSYKGEIYFAADNGVSGFELYKTDGTEFGTRLVADIAPGGASSSLGALTIINGLLYFAASDAVAGRELWQSDGTAPGTVRVADLNPGVTAANPGTIVGVKGAVFFTASTPVAGLSELWVLPRPLSVEVVGGDLAIVENEYWNDDNDVRITYDPLAQEIVVSVAAGPFVGLSGVTTATGAVRISLAEFAGGAIDIKLGGGADRVTLDLSGGFFDVAGGVDFDGEVGTDRLVVIGSHAEEVEYASQGPDEAAIDVGFGAQTLEVTAASIVQAEVSSLASLRVTSGGGADEYLLSVAKIGAAPATALLTGSTDEVDVAALAFSLISALSLDLAAGDEVGAQDDLLTVTGAGLAALELKELLIATGAGSDTIVATAGGFNVDELLSISGEHLNIPGGLSLEGSMAVAVAGEIVGQIIGGSLIAIAPTGSSTLGLASSFRGVDLAGELSVGPWTVTLQAATLARLGALTTLEGGALIAAKGVSLSDGDVIAGHGSVGGRLAAGTGSSVIATGALQLGDALSPAGVVSDGELHAGANTVTLHDANEAVLGALTTLGSASEDGALAAANGYFLGEGRNLSGRGSITGPFHNDGHVFSTDSLVFANLVTGIGDFTGNLTFGGGISPGHSPAEVDINGNVTLGSGNVLSIELGGTQAGSQYDRLNATGAANVAGSLAVTLINGFTPQAGDAFDILIATAGVNGAFAAESLPALAEGLEWDLEFGTDAVTLTVVETGLAADFDGNGQVDGNDFLAWQRGLGASSASKADGDADHDDDVDENDLGAWRMQFGAPAESAAASSLFAATTPSFHLPADVWLAAPTAAEGRQIKKLAVEIAADDVDSAEMAFAAFAQGAASSGDDAAYFDSVEPQLDDDAAAADDAFAEWEGLVAAL